MNEYQQKLAEAERMLVAAKNALAEAETRYEAALQALRDAINDQ